MLFLREGGLVVRHRSRECERRVGAKGGVTGERFEEHDAQRIHVARTGRGLAGESLRSQVRDRSEHRSDRRVVAIVVELRNAEVGELHRRGVGQQDIARFDVAVQDAESVCGTQPCEQVRGDRAHANVRHRTRLQLVRQGAARQPLHHDVGHSVVFADVEHPHDIGMDNPSRGARFALEPVS